MHRVYLAFLVFFRILFGKPLPEEVVPKALPPTPPPTPELPPAKPAKKTDNSVGALQLLALLQREGRLLDFLNEAIDDYDDAAIGAAVRDIHRGCKKVIDEHVAVEPVLEGAEDEAVTVDASFDPRRIRLVGNVVGKPPYRGVLKHHGWRAAKVALPTITDGLDTTIVAPAEVELS